MATESHMNAKDKSAQPSREQLSREVICGEERKKF